MNELGFIEMKSGTEAEGAIAALNGTNLGGSVLKVNQARPQLHGWILHRNRSKGLTL